MRIMVLLRAVVGGDESGEIFISRMFMYHASFDGKEKLNRIFALRCGGR